MPAVLTLHARIRWHAQAAVRALASAAGGTPLLKPSVRRAGTPQLLMLSTTMSLREM